MFKTRTKRSSSGRRERRRFRCNFFPPCHLRQDAAANNAAASRRRDDQSPSHVLFPARSRPSALVVVTDYGRANHATEPCPRDVPTTTVGDGRFGGRLNILSSPPVPPHVAAAAAAEPRRSEETDGTYSAAEKIIRGELGERGGERGSPNNASREGFSARGLARRPSETNVITALFSAPLAYHDIQHNLLPFPKLNFSAEKEQMWKCLEEANRDIELSFDTATLDRVLATITKGCACLHYSGHGHQQPNDDELGPAHAGHEDYLSFENGCGGSRWFKQENFEKLIDGRGSPPFQVVFVSACHSRRAGQALASAGVPHVVCCEEEFELADVAALQFTQQFYFALMLGRTVKLSFERGLSAVRSIENLKDAEKETEKFVLLPVDGNHDVPVFDARTVDERGVSRRPRLSSRNMIQEDPSPPPPHSFLGRDVVAYRVLQGILDKKLVSVVGEEGIGRSSLVRFLCHYVNERASTMPFTRIFYIRAEQGDCFRSLAGRLIKKMGKRDIVECDSDLRSAICRTFKNEKALVVFDHVEYLKDSDEFNKFCSLLADILLQTKAKVLITALRPLSAPDIKFEGSIEVPFTLEPLNFLDTVKLFSKLNPEMETPTQRQQFCRALSTNLPEGGRALSGPTQKIFNILGGGIPSRILDAAGRISKHDLIDLVVQIDGRYSAGMYSGKSFTPGNGEKCRLSGCTEDLREVDC